MPPTVKWSETELLRAAVGGDEAALAMLLDGCQRELQDYVRRHLPACLRSSVDPEDILQNVACAAVAYIGRFRPQGERAFVRWVMSIARRDLLRRAQRQARFEPAEARRAASRNRPSWTNGRPAMPLEELMVDASAPSQAVVLREQLGAMRRVLDRLPEDARAALRLHYMHGLAARDVAVVLRRSEHAVHCLCSRSLALLRLELGSSMASR